jgi:hypothetical protein
MQCIQAFATDHVGAAADWLHIGKMFYDGHYDFMMAGIFVL